MRQRGALAEPLLALREVALRDVGPQHREHRGLPLRDVLLELIGKAVQRAGERGRGSPPIFGEVDELTYRLVDAVLQVDVVVTERNEVDVRAGAGGDHGPQHVVLLTVVFVQLVQDVLGEAQDLAVALAGELVGGRETGRHVGEQPRAGAQRPVDEREADQVDLGLGGAAGGDRERDGSGGGCHAPTVGRRTCGRLANDLPALAGGLLSARAVVGRHDGIRARHIDATRPSLRVRRGSPCNDTRTPSAA